MATAPGVALEDIVEAKQQGKDVGQVSQWTLMRRRFLESKLSVAGGIILIAMYVVAVFAPFLSPYQSDALDSNFQYAAPTQLHIINGHISICGLNQTLNQAT